MGRQHSAINRPGYWCAIALLLCPTRLAAQDGASASQQAAEVRRELGSIDYRHYRDLDDYLSRCERVRALIPSLESFYKRSDAELERLRIKHSDDPHLLDLADFYVSLNSQDKAGLRVLEQEMGLAAEMAKLPSEKGRLSLTNGFVRFSKRKISYQIVKSKWPVKQRSEE
jgi:hypothetical protein